MHAHNIVFADSSEMCSRIVILGLVLSLVFAQERQDNRPQHLIHVQLTDQVSLFFAAAEELTLNRKILNVYGWK